MRPTAVVMNVFYTGLGIARSLGEQGIPVVGLTAQSGVYGNYTRYARTVCCPDSRREPEALLATLLELGREAGHRGVIFPTRDDDVVFLDRYRKELEPYFVLTVPESPVIQACLDKYETFVRAERAGVLTPKCRLIASEEELYRALRELVFPCVMKPVEAHHWRQGGNWQLVGGRKAIGVNSAAETVAEYKAIARANQRVLLQEMVAGADDCLVIAACYMDRQSNFVAGFNTQKLVQIPERFGTGCIVQTVERPELFERTVRLLRQMRYTGIAEVEYKWDATRNDYQLIEINPRPWDQHRLGHACGVDLIHLAYREHAGLVSPRVQQREGTWKWLAEDTFVMAFIQSLWRRDGAWRQLLHLARGRRTYAIWSWRDPMPSLVFMTTRFLPGLIADAARVLGKSLKKKTSSQNYGKDRDVAYERPLENENRPG